MDEPSMSHLFYRVNTKLSVWRMTMISAPQLLFEMFLVGLGLVAIAAPLHAGAMAMFGDQSMHHVWLAVQVVMAGALFHFLCEITGLNTWYCVHVRPESCCRQVKGDDNDTSIYVKLAKNSFRLPCMTAQADYINHHEPTCRSQTTLVATTPATTPLLTTAATF